MAARCVFVRKKKQRLRPFAFQRCCTAFILRCFALATLLALATLRWLQPGRSAPMLRVRLFCNAPAPGMPRPCRAAQLPRRSFTMCHLMRVNDAAVEMWPRSSPTAVFAPTRTFRQCCAVLLEGAHF